MSRDSQRYRKTYSYYRVQPKTELLEVIVDETLDWKHSVRAASTTSVSLAGSTPLTIDDVTLADEDRVLLKDQGSGTENGIYYFEVTNGSYVLTRAPDARQGTISCGATTYAEEGTVNSGKIFIMSTTGPITVGTTAMSWTLFSGAGSGVGGSGTTNYVSKFTASSTVGNSIIYDNSAGIGIGTTSFSGRFYVTGSDSAIPTAVIKGGYASLFDVQNFSGTSILFATGTLGTVGGRVGIGTSQPDAKFQVSSSYGGSAHGISIGKPNFLGLASNAYTSLQHNFYGGDGTTQRMMIDSAGNTILGGAFPGLTSNTARLFVTGSSTSTDQGIVYKSGVASPTGPLLDIKNHLGNSIIFVSGSGLSGSLTKLTDGTSYLVAGDNVTITTGSNGSVTIGTTGPVGSGTDGFLTQWTGTSTLGNSFIKDMTPNGSPTIAKYYKNYHYFEDQTGGGTYVQILSNNSTGGRIGINNSPSFALDIIAGANSINEAIRVRNDDASQGTGLRQTFIAGNYSEPTFRITHAWPSVTEGHYTFLGITKPTPSAGTPSIVERLKIYSSGSVEVSGSLVARLDPEIINKPILSAQKSNGREVLWISSSAGTNTVGTDVFMWVSGSRTDNNTGTDKVVFGGDVRVSGSLSVGTGSVLVTANDIQFGSSGTRIEKNGNDIKFFDLNNASGKTLAEITAASPSYFTSTVSGAAYTTGSVGVGTTSVSERLSIHNGGQDRVGFGISSAVSTVYLGSTTSTEAYRAIEFDRSTGSLHFKSGSVGSSMLAMATFDQYGRLGIGNTSPTTKLFVQSSSDVQIEATDGTVSQRVGYCLNSVAYSGTSTGHPYALLTTDVERVRIDTSGNVGIGTSTINARLDILSSDGDEGVIVRQGTTAPASATPILQVKGYDGGTVLWVSGSSTHGARVGIGTTNPRSICMLDVGSKGSTGTNNYVNVEASSTGECGYSWTAGGANPLWKFSRAASTSNISLIEQGSSNVALLCEYSTGNVGIGTSSISARLHVSGSGTGTTTTLMAKHGVANGSSLPVLDVQNSTGNSLLYVSGSGFVGIGTSTASATTNFLKALGGNVVSISGPSASAILLEVNGNLSGTMVVSDSGMTVVPGANRTLGLGSDNSVKLSIDTEGDVNLQTSDRYFDASLSSGQGIRLRTTPGNSDAQVLDAYYEKDLVVTLESTNSNLDCALYSSAQTLKFTRIGRMVTISGHLQVETVTSTGTGRLYIDLGTASGERPSSMSAVALYINQPDAAVDWNNPVIAYADSGTSRIYIDRYNAGQGLSNGLTLSQFVEADQEFMVSVSYSTN